jgi:hypothetical protein
LVLLHADSSPSEKRNQFALLMDQVLSILRKMK